MDRNAKLFLSTMTVHTFAAGLTNVFVNVYLWEINHSFTLLALYSLVYSLVVLISFPICAWFARWRTPLESTRLGIVFLLASYALILMLKRNTVHHIVLLGACLGFGVSLFVIGQHILTLDSTKDLNRDRFLYISNLLSNLVGMAAPLLGGSIIDRFHQEQGYYIVFALSVFFFAMEFLMTLKIKGKPIERKSYLFDVWKNPSREWRGMFWVTIGSAMIEGTYSTFLVTIMMFSILKNTLLFGGYNTFVAAVGALTSIVFAAKSSPERRLFIFGLGAVLVALPSVAISLKPDYVTLCFYALLASIGFNLVNTNFDSWSYASIERDPDFERRRLDYIIIREVPLGIGRTLGIALFLGMQFYLTEARVLSVSFAVFGSLYLLMLPILIRIWPKAKATVS